MVKVTKTLQLSLQALMTITIIQYVAVLLFAWMSPSTFGIVTATFENVITNYWVALDGMISIVILYFTGIAE